MSTGISISSINRIKELAEEKRYAEALEILDTQNLDKSINPQFLRISGEIFRENKRYYDSRRILLKAHQMAPQGNRIISELMLLYLELGYYTKAQKYYDQYLFNSTQDDIQRDFVEYSMKKALGADIKELASIMIPILERMPEDKWNFEAVLLYDKMGRKDKALEESRFFLENYKESEYVQPIIDYIDDKLDVDKYFYIYPKDEQEEDKELFGELIEQEEKLLEADYLRMHPPEARIMVEADDKDAIEPRPVKEKKPKKKKKKENPIEDLKNADEKQDDKNESKDAPAEEKKADIESDQEADKSIIESSSEETQKSDSSQQSEEVNPTEELQDEKKDDSIDEEQLLREKREAALEVLLSKKIDTEKIKESAKQVAKAVKEIDTEKTKQQMKSVAETVKDNVKKATDALSEAVGTKQENESEELFDGIQQADGEEIVDGIIESVLEPPKKVVGKVVMNEELDALIPDSLEAMSAEEIADIEARKEEAERLELEALEASLQLEERKKTKSRWNKKKSTDSDIEEGTENADGLESNAADNTDKIDIFNSENEDGELDNNVSNISDDKDDKVDSLDYKSQTREEEKESDLFMQNADSTLYEELKEKYLSKLKNEDEKPLDSLGFITVVHSDVDSVLDEAMPDAAQMLHQMIDNKEFYTGENSNGFESQASYLNHGFEIEDYDFDEYREVVSNDEMIDKAELGKEESSEDVLSVKVIYAKEQIVEFDEIVPKDTENVEIKAAIEQPMESITFEDTDNTKEKEVLQEESIDVFEDEEAKQEESIEVFANEEPEQEKQFTEKAATMEMPRDELAEATLVDNSREFDLSEENMLKDDSTEEALPQEEASTISEQDDTLIIDDDVIELMDDATEMLDVRGEEIEEEGLSFTKQNFVERDTLRVGILLTDKMVNILMDLKESR